MKKEFKLTIKCILIIIIALISVFILSNQVESANSDEKDTGKVESFKYNDYGTVDPKRPETYHEGIDITFNGYDNKIYSMPELANWMKTQKNEFFSLDLSQLIGKNLNQKRYSNTGSGWDKINEQGHVGAVSANNGMCLCENQGNSVESYTLYNAIELEYVLGKGYKVKLYKKGTNGIEQSLTSAGKTYVAKLIQSFNNISKWGGTGFGTAEAALYKNEAKYYIYYLRSKFGLDNSPITLNGGSLDWLSKYAKRWNCIWRIY